MTEPVDVGRRREVQAPATDVERGALLAVLERLVASVQALHDRLDTLERGWKARGSL